MSYKTNFLDNVLYGVEDLNHILKNLTNAGIDVYGEATGQLNAITQAAVSAGVTNVQDSCKVIWANDTYDQLRILPGVAFFPNGATITLYDGGEMVLPTGRYVYLQWDSSGGRPICSDTAPTGNDLLLAEVVGDVILDRRMIATSKVAGFGTSQEQKSVHLSFSNSDWETLKTFTLTRGDYVWVILLNEGSYAATAVCNLMDPTYTEGAYRGSYGTTTGEAMAYPWGDCWQIGSNVFLRLVPCTEDGQVRYHLQGKGYGNLDNAKLIFA